MTINALTFLDFDDDSLTNRDLFIKLCDNVFFIFFEFIISTFVHELLSREFVMLLFFAICINIENDSKDVFNFKFATIFFSLKRSFFIREKTSSILWILWRRIWKFHESFAIFLRNTISFWYDALNWFFSFFFSFCNSKFTRYVHDLHIRRIFCVCRWCWDRNRSFDAFSRMCHIWQQFCNVYQYNRIFKN